MLITISLILIIGISIWYIINHDRKFRESLENVDEMNVVGLIYQLVKYVEKAEEDPLIKAKKYIDGNEIYFVDLPMNIDEGKYLDSLVLDGIHEHNLKSVCYWVADYDEYKAKYNNGFLDYLMQSNIKQLHQKLMDNFNNEKYKLTLYRYEKPLRVIVNTINKETKNRGYVPKHISDKCIRIIKRFRKDLDSIAEADSIKSEKKLDIEIDILNVRKDFYG